MTTELPQIWCKLKETLLAQDNIVEVGLRKPWWAQRGWFPDCWVLECRCWSTEFNQHVWVRSIYSEGLLEGMDEPYCKHAVNETLEMIEWANNEGPTDRPIAII